ncbi:hypothetical protein Afil01_18990 [Actinorhabdospora filicis]|uniref:FG-GAP repeat protein n=1 Tax=Actinorhabdospora filicis TaxID=1785913 RepID=A0A9W6W2J8_9ACTN|nr:integrin alpha [Actinorhabdospora filicis]GLZ77092.1 hypothetical protein Afil01_18990 [Actinorhabdospora filicis]
MRSTLRACVSALALAAVSLVVVPGSALAEPVPATDVEMAFPAGPPVDLVVDDARGLVYHASPTGLTVLDFDGTVQRTIAGSLPWRTLTMSADGSRLYATARWKNAIDVIDTATWELSTVRLPATHCLISAEFTGGLLWYSYFTCGNGKIGSLASYDPATGTVTESGLSAPAGNLTALPGRPDRLVQRDWNGEKQRLRIFDVSGAPREVAVSSFLTSHCGDVALIDGGERLALSCNRAYDLEIFDTATLTSTATKLTENHGGTLAVSPDGAYFAVGGPLNGPGTHVEIVKAADMSTVRIYDYPGAAGFYEHPMAWLGDGRLMTFHGSRLRLHLEPAKYITDTYAAALWKAVPYGEAAVLRGYVRGGPDRVRELTVTREDRLGRHPLGRLATGLQGGFEFTDAGAPVSGKATYTFDFAGDAYGTVASVSVTVATQAVPFDFNGDGIAEAVVGTPGEDDGSITDTGQVHVFPTTTAGVTAGGSLAFDQSWAGLVGDNAPGDRLGAATASGDFNGDGFADLAIGAPGKDAFGAADSGAVIVAYGSASGLTSAGSVMLTPDNAPGALTGHALAAADFNTDGIDELAVGAPGTGSGTVYLYTGNPSGLSNPHALYQSSDEIPGRGGGGNAFGWSLAAGRVQGPHVNPALAIGAPQDREDAERSTGSVTVLYGLPFLPGQTVSKAQRFTKETPGVPGTAGPHDPKTGDGADEFGLKVAIGDFNGDGDDDLAVSAPGTNVTSGGKKRADAGSVTVLYSDGYEIGTTGAKEVTQDTDGIVGLPYDNDFFGDNLATGDTNGDGADELAIFSYGDEYVTITPGATSGLAFTSTTAWTQDSPGIPGSHESGDKWGASLRFLTGAKPALLVGAPGEDDRQGAFTVVYIGPKGLTGDGARYFGEGTPGVPGEPENGDGFGTF